MHENNCENNQEQSGEQSGTDHGFSGEKNERYRSRFVFGAQRGLERNGARSCITTFLEQLTGSALQ